MKPLGVGLLMVLGSLLLGAGAVAARGPAPLRITIVPAGGKGTAVVQTSFSLQQVGAILDRYGFQGSYAVRVVDAARHVFAIDLESTSSAPFDLSAIPELRLVQLTLQAPPAAPGLPST